MFSATAGGSPAADPIADVVDRRTEGADGERAPQDAEQHHRVGALDRVLVDEMSHRRPVRVLCDHLPPLNARSPQTTKPAMAQQGCNMRGARLRVYAGFTQEAVTRGCRASSNRRDRVRDRTMITGSPFASSGLEAGINQKGKARSCCRSRNVP